MKHVFFLSASTLDSGLSSVALGVFRSLDRKGVRVGFCKPISQEFMGAGTQDPSIALIRKSTGFRAPDSLSLEEAQRFVREDRVDALMEKIVALVETSFEDVDVMVVEGLLPSIDDSFLTGINAAMAQALNAEIILTHSFSGISFAELEEDLEVAASAYGNSQNEKIIGAILNKVFLGDAPDQEASLVNQSPINAHPTSQSLLNDRAKLLEFENQVIQECSIFRRKDFDLIGCIPWNDQLPNIRVSDVARELGARVINEGHMQKRRVRSVMLTARHVANILELFEAGTLIVTPNDRVDILITAALATHNHVPMAGVILTGSQEMSPRLKEMCQSAFDAGLPVLQVDSNSFETATRLSKMRNFIAADDEERFNTTCDFVARHLRESSLRERIETKMPDRLSPPAFRHRLSKMARKSVKRIILPEGEEPRTVSAASICARRKLAIPVLLGDKAAIERVATGQGVSLDGVEIIDPAIHRERFVENLVERRRHKNMNTSQAREALEDNIMLGTMMLANGEVDGLVSGAIHSTAHTMRPALQLIKTAPHAKMVSSVFFMCLPDQVLVYGDCAINPDPTAETLADIAIQSADSARQFGIDPSVAMISYSTGESGAGADVDKVREATRLAKELRPDLVIDGPLQYDAASERSVAKTKAPDSPVAGNATVFIFPDLNTGNTTYKAVQRSANVVSIGPMLQGLRKPVNDLSRGAWVEDIVYTITITAIQAAAVAASAE